MNWPNFISVCRVMAIPLFIYFLAYGHGPAAFFTFLAASLSDALDGFLARLLGQKTVLGTFLDPLADKLMTATAFVASSVVGLVPVWLLIIVVSRDVILSLGALVSYMLTGGLEIKPRPLGKVTTFFQFVTVSAALASPFVPAVGNLTGGLFAATALLTVTSGLQYVWAGLLHLGAEG